MHLASDTLRSLTGVMGTPLATGDAGVEHTIDVLRRIVDDGVKDPEVNRTAIKILRDYNVQNFSIEDRVQAIYAWISNPANFLYVPDPIGPFGPKETLRPIRTLLAVRGGDCDDFTSLLCALLGTIGIPTRAVTIAADPSSPEDFSHIYPEAQVSARRWVAIDAARPGAAYGAAPPFYFRKRVWSLTDKSYCDLKGASAGVRARRVSSLNGYAMLGAMGDDSVDPTAQDIAVSTQGIANIIAAANGNPWGSFSTPYTPSAVAPQAGYYPAGYPGAPGAPGASLNLAANPSVWWILGLVAAAAVLKGVR